jgi:hypothetical protein
MQLLRRSDLGDRLHSDLMRSYESIHWVIKAPRLVVHIFRAGATYPLRNVNI